MVRTTVGIRLELWSGSELELKIARLKECDIAESEGLQGQRTRVRVGHSGKDMVPR